MRTPCFLLAALLLSGCALPRTAFVEGAIQPDSCTLSMNGMQSKTQNPTLALRGIPGDSTLSAWISCGSESGETPSHQLYISIDGLPADSLSHPAYEPPLPHGRLLAGEYPLSDGWDVKPGEAVLGMSLRTGDYGSSCWRPVGGVLEVLRPAEAAEDLNLRFRMKAKRRVWC